MNESVKWALELVDRVSGPAKKIADGLARIEKSARGSFGRGARAMGGALRTIGAGSAQFAKDFAKHLGPSIAAGSAAFVAAVGAVAVAAGKYAIDVLAAKEQTALAFRTLVGEKDAGALQARVAKMSAFFGKSVQEVSGQVTDLVAAGFSAEDAMTLLQGAFDMKALVGSDVGQLSSTFAQIAAAGKLTTQDAKQAGITGKIGMGNIKRELAAIKGVDVSQVDKLIESGAITSQEATVGIMRAVQGLTKGQLGSFAAKGTGSITGILDQIKNAPENLLNATDLSGVSDQFKAIGKSIADALNPETSSGKATIVALERVGGVIADLLGRVDVAAVVDGISSAISAIGASIEGTSKFLGGFSDGLGTVLGPLRTVIRLWPESSDGSSSFARSLVNLGKVVGWVVGFLVLGFGTIAGAVVGVANAAVWLVDFLYVAFVDGLPKLWNLITGGFVSLVEWLGEVGASFKAWGGAIVAGLWQGIKDRWRALVTDLKGLLDLLPDAAKKALGIASPSRVFAMEVGRWIPEGIAEGVAANSNAADAAVAELAGPPKFGGFGSSSTPASVSVIVNVAGTSASPEEIAAAVRLELVRVLGAA